MIARGFYNSDAAAEHYLGVRWPRAIWAAVLKQAIEDVLLGPSGAELKGMTLETAIDFKLRTQAAALYWIADDANEPRRFVWVCEQLGVSPSAVRRSIEARRLA